MAKEKKKILSPKQEKILNWVLVAVQVVVVVACIAISVFVIMGANAQKEENKLGDGMNMMVVLSDSMTGNNKDSFNPGDMIFVKKFKSQEDYKNIIADKNTGTVVTYYGYLQGLNAYGFVSHRVVDTALDDNGVTVYAVQGDKEGAPIEWFYASSFQGMYIGKLPKVGYVINWLQKPTNFFCVIVIPLALLLIYNVVLIIKMAMDVKTAKMEKEKRLAIEEIKKQVQVNAIDEEEIKRRAIEEYLASKKKED